MIKTVMVMHVKDDVENVSYECNSVRSKDDLPSLCRLSRSYVNKVMPNYKNGVNFQLVVLLWTPQSVPSERILRVIPWSLTECPPPWLLCLGCGLLSKLVSRGHTHVSSFLVNWRQRNDFVPPWWFIRHTADVLPILTRTCLWRMTCKWNWKTWPWKARRRNSLCSGQIGT